MMVVFMEVKRNLIDLRVDAGFESQAALARAAGLAESTVWQAENGRRISRTSARKIVNALRSRGIAVEVQDIDWNVSR
jgi:biotin operon repressor